MTGYPTREAADASYRDAEARRVRAEVDLFTQQAEVHRLRERVKHWSGEAGSYQEIAIETENKLAALVRLANAYRAAQLELREHKRGCRVCVDGQACDEAGSLLDEMGKRRAPFWRALDEALAGPGAGKEAWNG